MDIGSGVFYCGYFADRNPLSSIFSPAAFKFTVYNLLFYMQFCYFQVLFAADFLCVRFCVLLMFFHQKNKYLSIRLSDKMNKK